MPKPEEKIIDLSNVETKRKLLTWIGAKTGPWLLSLRPFKPRRSNRANAYYHAAVIPTIREFFREHGQVLTRDEIHESLLKQFAGRDIYDPLTGEVLDRVGNRSSDMDSGQFSDFVNQVIEWMADRFGVVIPSPMDYAQPNNPNTAPMARGKTHHA